MRKKWHIEVKISFDEGKRQLFKANKKSMEVKIYKTRLMVNAINNSKTLAMIRYLLLQTIWLTISLID